MSHAIVSISQLYANASRRPAGYVEELLASGESDGSYLRIERARYESLVAKYRSVAESGPGTELKRMLKLVGIAASPNCSCNARAREMDAKGCDWCEKNIDTIVGWLRQEAAKRRLPFLDLPARMLVKRAIRAARKAEKLGIKGKDA